MLGALTEAHRDGTLIEVRRERIESGCIRGFVSGISNDFAVLSVVDTHCNFDGIIVIRVEDVTFARWDSARLRAWSRVLQESPSAPASVKHIDLTSWETIVRSVAAAEDVVTFHRENVNDDECHVGTNVRLDGELVVADEITIRGTIEGQFTLETGDLTKLDAGGGYELALWRMLRSANEA